MKTTPSNQHIYAYLFSLSAARCAVLIRTMQRRVVHSVVTNDGTLPSSIIIGPAMTLRSHRENSKTKTATVFTSRRGIQWQSRTCWPVLPALQHSGSHRALSETAHIEIEHRPGHVGNDPTLQKPPHIHRREGAWVCGVEEVVSWRTDPSSFTPTADTDVRQHQRQQT